MYRNVLKREECSNMIVHDYAITRYVSRDYCKQRAHGYNTVSKTTDIFVFAVSSNIKSPFGYYTLAWKRWIKLSHNIKMYLQ